MERDHKGVVLPGKTVIYTKDELESQHMSLKGTFLNQLRKSNVCFNFSSKTAIEGKYPLKTLSTGRKNELNLLKVDNYFSKVVEIQSKTSKLDFV